MNEDNYKRVAQSQAKALSRCAREAVETNAELRALRRQVKAQDKTISALRKALAAERRVNRLVAALSFDPRQKTSVLRVYQKAERAAQQHRNVA